MITTHDILWVLGIVVPIDIVFGVSGMVTKAGDKPAGASSILVR